MLLRVNAIAFIPGMRPSDPHGEERDFARLRTMLRIALRTMRPRAYILTIAAASERL
jgi:hypothetical protein